MNNDSLVGRLLERSVPQIPGLYIAAKNDSTKNFS
jgi:hypothetical protein